MNNSVALRSNEGHNSLIDKKQRLNAEVLIILISVAVHIAFFVWNLLIGGVYVDEAMTVLNARSLVENQTDIMGEQLPVYFDTWLHGGQSPAATYCVALFVKLFGECLFAYRLPALIMSIIGLLAFNSFIKNVVERREEQLVFLALAAFSPWQIFSGVYMLDCNFYPHIMMIAVMLLSKAVKGGKTKFYILSMVFFGLSFYCYIASAIITPVFLAVVFIILLVKKKIGFKNLALSFVTIFCVSLAFILFGLVTLGAIEPFSVLGFSISDMPYYTRSSSITLNPADALVNLIFGIYIFVFPEMALKSVINSIFLYTNLLGGIFMLIGIVSTSKEIRKRKKGRGFLFKLFFTASLICVLLFCAVSKTTFGTLYRFGVLTYFLVFFEGAGCIAFCRKVKKINLKGLVCGFLCASMLLFTAEFAFIYTNGLKSEMSVYGDSLFESIEFVEEKSGKDNFSVFLGTTKTADDIALAERYLVFLEYYFDSNDKLLPYKEQIFELTAINDDIRNGKVKTVSNTTDGSIKCSFAENVNQLTDDYNIVYSDYLDILVYSQEYTVEDFGAWSVVYKNPE